MAAEAKLDVHLKGLEPDHPASLAALEELLSDLRSESELRAEQRGLPDKGSKGAVVELIVSLGASGSIPGLVRIVQLWLGRDRRRSLTVFVRDEPGETVVNIEGDQISTETLSEALRSLGGFDRITGRKGKPKH